jgi:selenocysteine-specific translation elongation factor
LDEDQERVLPGTRIGFALRNVKLEEIEGVSALIKPGVKLRDKMSYTKFKWASEATSLHLFAGGLKVMAEVSGNELKLGRPIPETVVRGILVNFNAKPKTPKVFGWAHS